MLSIAPILYAIGMAGLVLSIGVRFFGAFNTKLEWNEISIDIASVSMVVLAMSGFAYLMFNVEIPKNI